MSREIPLEPVLLDIASGENGFVTPIPRPLLKVLKVQGVNMKDPYNPSDDPAKWKYAYRMFVNDGKYTMIACLNPNLHFYIDLQVLTRGAYIRPVVYDVRTEVKKASDKKFTRYLVIHDLTVEYSPTFIFQNDENGLDDERVKEVDGDNSTSKKIKFLSPVESSEPVSTALPAQASPNSNSSISPTPPTSAQQLYVSPEDGTTQTSASSQREIDSAKMKKSLKHRLEEEEEPKSLIISPPSPKSEDSRNMPPPPLPASRTEGRQLRSRAVTQVPPAPSSTSSLRRQTRTPQFKYPSQPAPIPSPNSVPDITPLGQLINTLVGRRVNVLVIVTWVSDRIISRNIGNKRDMELLDQTSNRPTRLSVWLDLDKFIPKAGEIVLFRGLYVHKFDGRSLNAFQELEGTAWYESEPDIEQAAELRNWYRSKLENKS